MTPSKSSHSLAVWAVLAMLSLAACGAEESAAPSPATAGSPTAFEAGEYQAEGEYPTPGGVQSISVAVDLEADGTILDIDVEPQAEVGNSVQFQGKFAGGIAKKVVGRPITELSVDKVSGSSLTSKGFNKAIAEIITEAQA